jgi:tetratricopeptide (TPR) repeat protein
MSGSWNRRAAAALVCGIAIAAAAPTSGADGVSDAKRRAAADLLRQGRTADAIVLLTEVVIADPGQWRDQIALARAYDKANKTGDAIRAYRRAAEQLAAPSTADERAAAAEADKRLKVLDQQSVKLDAAVEDFLKKLDQLERDAAAARNGSAVDRIWKVRAGAVHGQDRPGRGACVVQANVDWQSSGFRVVKGARYRVAAHGTWRMSPGPEGECTPAGVAGGPTVVHGPVGMLIGGVDMKAPYWVVGAGGEFEAAASGTLYFVANEPAEAKADNSGSVAVVVVRQ